MLPPSVALLKVQEPPHATVQGTIAARSTVHLLLYV